MPFERCDPSPSGRLQLTAQSVNSDLGWAEITHPFHPFKGQQFPVLKTRRVAGKDTLVLRHPERGSFGIIREWTDWGAPTGSGSPNAAAGRFDIGMLLDLVDLFDLLADSTVQKSFTKELDK